ncbi:MAG: hypothetical protein R3F43_21715 [bacterium]
MLGALLGGEAPRVGVERRGSPLPWYLVVYGSVTGAGAGHVHAGEAEEEAEGRPRASRPCPRRAWSSSSPSTTTGR